MLKKISLSIVCMLAILLAGCDQNIQPPQAEEVQVDFNKIRNMTLEEEEAAMKLEPAYGQVYKISYNGGLCLGTLGLAKALGYYAEEGLEVELVNIPDDTDALALGKVVALGGHIAQLTVPTVNGLDIIFTGSVHTGCKTLYVLANGGITSTTDLIGKKVGVPSGIGHSDHNIGLRFFNKDKIDPTTVRFTVVEAGASILAMQNGDIQGVVLSDQFAKKFVDDGTIIPIRSLTFDEDFKEELCCVFAMNKTFVKENPVIAKRLTRAHTKASAWLENNKVESVKLLQANNWAAGNPNLILEMLESWTYHMPHAKTEATLRSIFDDYKTFGLIDKNKDTDDLIKLVWLPLAE